MLKFLEISNFESHKNTKIAFTPGVNVIVGQSESGKSAILRAINWVVFNRPSGDAFRSHWGGSTTVKIETDDALITRTKSSKDNKYTLQYLDDDKPTEFKAIGTNVPEQITKALEIHPINIQTQFAGHFLLPPVSPGEVAKQINQFVDLEVIDKSTSNSNSALREFKRSISNLNDQVRTQKAEIEEKYSKLDDANEFLSSLEKIELRSSKLHEGLLNLETIVVDLCGFNDEIYNYVEITQAEQELITIEEVSKIVSKEDLTLKELKDIVYQSEEVFNKLNAIRKKTNENALNILNKISITKNEDYKQIQNLKEIIKVCAYINNEITSLNIQMDATEKEFRKHMPIGSECPLCGQYIKE